MAQFELTTWRRGLVRWIENPWVDLVIGVFVLVTAVFEFTVEEAHQLDGAKGLFLLGGWVILRAILRLLESVDLMLDSAQSFYGRQQPRWLNSNKITVTIHLLIAVLLVVIGITEATHEFQLETQSGQVWHLNLIVIGAMILVKTAGELMEAIYFASKAANKTMHRGAQKLIGWVRFPRIELAMAFLVLFISIWEQLVRPFVETGLAPHHGLAFYAVVHVTRFMASMSETTDLVFLSDSDTKLDKLSK